MEVVTASPNGNSPFHNHDVREWSRLDRFTGVLERARMESDHWTASSNDGTHKYGKVIDSRACSTASGNHLAQAQRQLEVFQSHHQSGGGTTTTSATTSTSSRLQVIKTQTAVVSSNSSRWLQQQQQNIGRSSSKATLQSGCGILSGDNDIAGGRKNDVINGKKDAVLQGFDSLQLALNPLDLSSQKSKASVGRSVGRRPPSRSRLKEDAASATSTTTASASPTTSSSQSSSIAAAAAAFRFQTTAAATNLHRVSRLCHQIHETVVKNTFGNTTLSLLDAPPREDGDGSVEITEIECGSETNKPSLTRTKSTSSEDLHEKTFNRSPDDSEDLEQLQNWRRNSKLRRSLQYPNRQLRNSTSRPPDLPENKGSVRKIREDLETGRRLSAALRGNTVDLDALDQILQSISSSSSVQSDVPERDADLIVARKTKKSSFVTVESIKDMRSRLRRTSSPALIDKEDTDDGIVTEELPKPSDLVAAMDGSQSRVKSYVYGMESMLGQGKSISGTGSLESRTKQLNGNSSWRNEDWYSRRKSYGFEQVHDQAEDENSIASKTKNRVESSTDSGICRSTEIVVVPAATKVSRDSSNSSESDLDSKNRKYNTYAKLDKKNTMLKLDENPFSSRKASEELANIWNKRASSSIRDTYSPTNDCSLFPTKHRSDSGSWVHSDSERESSKSTATINNDDFKYNFSSNRNSDYTDDDTLANRKNNKKVEFCKTEVHFVADSGRVNIVETDEKPPPTQNFRRRRRNTGNLNIEELKKSGMPVLRFGDTTYEKTLFGDTEDAQHDNNSADEGVYETVQLNNDPPVSGGVVTVNINTPHYDYEDQKENYENGTPRGILKNKPVKPKPYILGDSTLLTLPTKSWSENPRSNTDTPIWRSTVTVRNTFYDKNGTSSDNNDISSDNERPEYGQLLRRQLRTTSNGRTADTKRNSENVDLLRGRHSPVDLRRSSWSVADRVKRVEDHLWTENKGYSTKINIGNGEATVVENRHPTWPQRDEDIKRNDLNKRLVVRIGKTEQNTNHVICSKTTTNPHQNGTTTTTKITIDLNPSPTNAQQIGDFATIPTIHKFPSQMPSSFKSPSLIMNTIKTEFHSNCSSIISDRSSGSTSSEIKIPQQLEALRRLYEDVQSDSEEADKEVQSLMSKNLDAERDGDNSSIVSGSWSKVTAFNRLNQFNNYIAITQNAHIEKVSGLNYSKLTPERDITSEPESKSKFIAEKSHSPQVIRRPSPIVTNQQKPVKPREHLPSPIPVQPSQVKKDNVHAYPPADNRFAAKTATEMKTATKSVEVLRQPKKSQMAYFGVEVSPTTLRKNKANAAISRPTKLSEKPDLLQFSSKIDNYAGNKRNIVTKASNGHIYENLNCAYRNKNVHPVKREFDSKILEELTKAADEILQAVNGYTDEERHNRFSTEEEDSRKFDPDALETISETKSVRNKTPQHHQKSTTSSRLKRASSTSSVDSVGRECLTAVYTPRSSVTSTTKSIERKYRNKKSPSSICSDVANKSQTKARRLQRASSREALLQSHGSSSEDLAIGAETTIRKPRLVKRTKTAQLTINSGIEIKKPSSMDKNKEPARRKPDERIPVGVPEIRHKIAVSTIRSTAEKVAASRERAKQRNEEIKKKSNQSRRDHIKGAGVTTPLRTTGTSINSSDSRCARFSSGREYSGPSSAPYRTVTSSSANAPFLKKPLKSDGLTKQ